MDPPRLLVPRLESEGATAKLAQDLLVLGAAGGWQTRTLQAQSRIGLASQALAEAARHPGGLALFPPTLNPEAAFGPRRLLYDVFWRTWGRAGVPHGIWLDDLASHQRAGAISARDFARLRRQEDRVIRRCDVLVVQHRGMLEGTVAQGRQTGVIEAGPLPYLTDVPIAARATAAPWRILWAGNLMARYLGDWPARWPATRRATLTLVGPNGEWMAPLSDVVVESAMPREKLEDFAQGFHFGMLAYADRLKGYLARGYTSKLSFYLAMGLPILAHNDAALAAGFVRDRGVGMVFSTLDELHAGLAALTDSEYARMARAASKEGHSVRQGRDASVALRDARRLLMH